MISSSRRHAVVIGASMAGLLAARALSDHFQRVTIIERDTLPGKGLARKGVPQGCHAHVLLARGYQILSGMFPSFADDLVAHGAFISDIRGRYDFHFRGYWPSMDTGMVFAGISRPSLEAIVTDHVERLPNVQILFATDSVGLSLRNGKVCAVFIKSRNANSQEALEADLVVDASGRGSHLPQWLKAHGFETPAETTVKVNISYASRLYHRDVPNSIARTVAILPEAPNLPCGGCIIPIEGDRYIVTLASMHREPFRDDAHGFSELARNLAAPLIHQFIEEKEPLSDIFYYRFPLSRWRHYERLRVFPRGLVVVGDAFSSFNPAYGQGMTVAAMDAVSLDSWLLGNRSDPRPLFKDIARNIDMAWQLSVGSDFAFVETQGKKTFATDLVNLYMTKLVEKAKDRPDLTLPFFQVSQLLKHPSTLFHPSVVARVLWGGKNRVGSEHHRNTAD